MVVLHETQSASFLPESLFESSSVWTTSHSLHSCLTLHLASRVSPQSMPTTKDRNFCTGQSRYPSGNGGTQSWVQQVGIQKGLLLGFDGSLVLQVKVTFLGGKSWENRRRVRENWEEQWWRSQVNAFLWNSLQCSRWWWWGQGFGHTFSLLVCNFNQALLILSVDCFSWCY